MGPRAFAHGDPSRFIRPPSRQLGFNGAAGFRPRRPAIAQKQQQPSLCFNGAAGFRPRRPTTRSGRLHRDWRLQWGRGLSPTETAILEIIAKIEASASMGPRAFAHGDLHAADCHPADWMGFNGAAGFRPRRQLISAMAEDVEKALQWGRGLSPTETRNDHMPAHRNQVASMGPRAFAHGDFDGSGKASLPTNRFNGAAGFRPRRLQERGPTRSRERCFNGAAGFRPRRPLSGRRLLEPLSQLQWGRGLSPTETNG